MANDFTMTNKNQIGMQSNPILISEMKNKILIQAKITQVFWIFKILNVRDGKDHKTNIKENIFWNLGYEDKIQVLAFF